MSSISFYLLLSPSISLKKEKIMANSYTDVPEIKFHMEHPLMKRIVELKERNYADYGQYDYAPKDYEDAQENYDSLLEITGDINANIIGPNSEDVDAEGPHC